MKTVLKYAFEKTKQFVKPSLKGNTSLKTKFKKHNELKKTITQLKKTSKKSANADFFHTQTQICDFIQKNCAPSSIINTEAETT